MSTPFDSMINAPAPTPTAGTPLSRWASVTLEAELLHRAMSRQEREVIRVEDCLKNVRARLQRQRLEMLRMYDRMRAQGAHLPSN